MALESSDNDSNSCQTRFSEIDIRAGFAQDFVVDDPLIAQVAKIVFRSIARVFT
jgi:hypothetical protein